MDHRYNMYVNQGERRIPSLVAQGEIDLPCINSNADSYMQQFDPKPLWAYLQNEGDLSLNGLYLSLYCTERPTYDGKRWFVRTAYNHATGGMRQEPTREVSWVNIKGMQFWNTSFREYAGIHQTKGIVDYSLYVSRVFGYCFLLGLSFNEDDEDDENSRIEFTNFYPSIHHYHQAVAINESDIYLDFDERPNWYPKTYGQDSEPEGNAVDSSIPQGLIVDEGSRLAAATARLSTSVQDWSATLSDAEESSDLSEILDLGEDSLEEEAD